MVVGNCLIVWLKKIDVIMQKRGMNECRMLIINYAIEIAFEKGWPYDFVEMKKDAKVKFKELAEQGYGNLDYQDSTDLMTLVEKDLEDWINTNDPTVKRKK